MEITGDFTLNPKEALPLLEQGLIGQEAKQTTVSNCLEAVIEQNSLDIPGVTAGDFAQAIVIVASHSAE